MPNLFDKNLDDLEYEDIQKLVEENKTPESLILDYKQEFDFQNPKKAGDKIKQEIAKDITGLANSSGGYLIYGVSELKENGANKPDKITGIDRIVCIDGKKHGPSIEDWLNQIITGGNVIPKVNYSPKIIEIPNSNKIVLILEMNESLNKPHMVLYNHAYCYYARSGTETKKADHLQVKTMFEFKDKYLLEFNNFRTRLNLDKDASFSNFAVSHFNKNLRNFSSRVSFLFTLIPYNLNININFNKDKFYKDNISQLFRSPKYTNGIYYGFFNSTLNHLGLTYYNEPDRRNFEHQEHCHIYKNGAVELGFIRSDDEKTIHYNTVETLKSYLEISRDVLEHLQIQEFNLNVSILNTLDNNLYFDNHDTIRYLNPNKLKLPNLHFEYDLTLDDLEKTQIKSTLAEFSDNLLAAFGIGNESEELPEFNRIFRD